MSSNRSIIETPLRNLESDANAGGAITPDWPCPIQPDPGGDDDQRTVWTIVLSGAIIVAALACSESPASTVTPSTAETSDEGTPVSASSKSPLRAAEHPELGTLLVDGEGFTLYMRNNDVPNLSTCSGSCAKTWPPLQASGELREMAGEGVDPDLLGSFKRFDGTQQVSYNRHPLYNYSEDEQPGDANGVEVGMGSLWFAMSPDGTAAMAK